MNADRTDYPMLADLLDALVERDGRLSAPTASAVAEDPAKAREWDALRHTWDALDALDAPAPSPDLRKRVMAGRSRIRRTKRIIPLRRYLLPAVAAAAVLLAVGLWMAWSGPETSAPTYRVDGLALSAPVEAGTILDTGDDEYATLVCPDGSAVALLPRTRLEVLTPPADAAQRFRLERGTVECAVEPRSEAPFAVHVPGDGRVEVLGTSFSVTVSEASTKVSVDSGRVRVRFGDEAVVLAAGENISRVRGPAFTAADPETSDAAEEDGASSDDTSGAHAPDPVPLTAADAETQAPEAILDEAVRLRLERLMRKAVPGKGAEWILALDELAEVNDPPAARTRVFEFFAERLRKAGAVETREVLAACGRQLRHADARAPQRLTDVLIRIVTTTRDAHAAVLAVESLGRIGDDAATEGLRRASKTAGVRFSPEEADRVRKRIDDNLESATGMDDDEYSQHPSE